MPDDPYKTLGLTKTATAEDIKKAYRKLVRSSHPDLHPDDSAAERRFKAISAAYDVLKTPESRARFDTGEIDASGAERPQRQYYRDFTASPDNAYRQNSGFGAQGDPADLFAEILRNRARQSGSDGFSGDGYGGDGFAGRGYVAQGPDLHFSLEVGFLDAVRGAQTRLTLPDGQSVAVTIPQGSHDGQTLRLRGKGGAGMGGGPAGDALISITLRPHPVFRRDGDDIEITLPITVSEAVLGGKVTAPTIDGPVEVTIPAGTSSGRVLRLRGRGVLKTGRPADGKTKGDQRIELRIVLPPEADPELRAFLQEARKTSSFDPRADLLKGAAT